MMFNAIHPRRHALGLTLVELMVAMTLGLILIGGVGTIVLSNGEAYRTNEALSQVQENARTAFELLSRDIREAGATGCGNTDRIANTLDDGGLWWQEAWTGVRGYPEGTTAPGTGSPARVAGDALLIQGIEGTGVSIVSHNPTSAVFFINATTTDFTSEDIVMACDYSHATIFQISNYNSNNVTVGHNTGNANPGNCSKGLGFPTDCTTTNGNEYQFGPNSQIARMSTVIWYIGNNGRPQEGGRSLYRRRITDVNAQEMVPGVTDMQLAFRVGDSTGLTTTPTAAQWDDVTAVEVTLTMNSLDTRVTTAPGVNGGRLQRTFTTIVGLRNRVE